MFGDKGLVLAGLQDDFFPAQLQPIVAGADQVPVGGKHLADRRGAGLADLLTHLKMVPVYIDDRDRSLVRHPVNLFPRLVHVLSHIKGCAGCLDHNPNPGVQAGVRNRSLDVRIVSLE